MALTCDWVIFCERAYFNPQRSPRSLQITNVIEQIEANQLPARISPFMVVARTSELGEAVIATRLIAPSSRDATPSQRPQPEAFEYANPYLLFRFGACAFVEEGPYRFQILFNGAVAYSAVLPVVVVSTSGATLH